MLTRARRLSNEELVEHVQNLSPEIRQLTIFPSDLCNYRCKMCHVWGETGWALNEPQKAIGEQLDIDVIKRLVDEVAAVNKKVNVIISGGEPLLYKHFEELVKYLRSKKITIFLFTNGSLIRGNIPLLLENVIGINISLDGPEEYHDSIRGKNSFNNICENIEILIREKKKSNRMFPYINIAMALSKYNYKSVKDFLKALRERFKDANIMLNDESKDPWSKRRDLSVSIQPLLFTTRERGEKYAAEMKELLNCDVSTAWEGFVEEPIGIDTDILKNDLEEIWRLEGVDYSHFVELHEYFYNIENLFGRSKCLAPWHEMVIRRTGDVYPCVDLTDYKLGNIYESSFKDIWEGDRANTFRELLKKRNLMMCNRCCRMFADKESY